ncbi:MAG TPA: hypothetical protein VGM88_28385 [Kofleriaceae bacterium]
MFPEIRSEAQLVDYLLELKRDPRWSFTREHPAGLETEDVLVGIRWQVDDAVATLPMGFAPFATMPVTRRAPYVCLAAWPGGHENPRWTRFDAEAVHFLDADLSALQLDDERYREWWRKSRDAAHGLLAETADDAAFYRSAAFRLSAAMAGRARKLWR